MKIDVELIYENLKQVFELSNKADIARFLEVSPNVISTWSTRNSTAQLLERLIHKLDNKDFLKVLNFSVEKELFGQLLELANQKDFIDIIQNKFLLQKIQSVFIKMSSEKKFWEKIIFNPVENVKIEFARILSKLQQEKIDFITQENAKEFLINIIRKNSSSEIEKIFSPTAQQDLLNLVQNELSDLDCYTILLNVNNVYMFLKTQINTIYGKLTT